MRALAGCCLLPVLLLAACGDGHRGVVVTAGVDSQGIEWSEAEQGQILAMHQLHSHAGTSAHALRLTGRTDSRVHDVHDLTVMVLSGTADVRLGGKWHNLVQGDIVEIPRGSVYLLDHTGSAPAEFYLIYYPPYDGKDLRMVEGR
jgi:mannose-6-phosphate isomerase-like protein (cupin superfamily)